VRRVLFIFKAKWRSESGARGQADTTYFRTRVTDARMSLRTSEYLNTIEAMKRTFKVAASTNDWLGLPITVFRVGGKEEPAVLVTAGASGVEVAGVYAALELLVQVDIERTTYILPSRDPTGLHEASFILSRMLGAQVEVQSLDDIRRVLKDSGVETLIDDGELFLALLKGVGIAVGSQMDAYEVLSNLRLRLHKEELSDALEGYRILIASQLPQVEGVGSLNRFLTVVVQNGEVLTYDDLERAEIPEVALLREFIEKQELGLVIDLHETKCPGFYAITSDPPSSAESTILYLVLDQVVRRGVSVADPELIKKQGLSSASEGVGYGKGACGLVDFAAPKSYALALAAPFNAPLDERIGALMVATLSALNAFIVTSL